MTISKKDVSAPVLPEPRAVSVPGLGEVLVRPLRLSERLALGREPRSGARERFGHIATLLAYTVVDADQEQLFDVDEWENWGAIHMDAALELWQVAWTVSGLDQDAAEKNSTAQT